MTRAELINAVAEQNVYIATTEIAEKCVMALLDAITEALANGNRVEIRNFGVFETRNRDARVGRNPRTGERVDVGPKRIPFFKASSQIKARLNEAKG